MCGGGTRFHRSSVNPTLRVRIQQSTKRRRCASAGKSACRYGRAGLRHNDSLVQRRHSRKNGPIDTKINLGSGGASNDNVNNVNLRLGATADFNLARFTLVAEVMEIFMAVNPPGWNPGDSSGEGLSQLGACTIYPDQRGAITERSPGMARYQRQPDTLQTEPSRLREHHRAIRWRLYFVWMRIVISLFPSLPTRLQHESGHCGAGRVPFRERVF